MPTFLIKSKTSLEDVELFAHVLRRSEAWGVGGFKEGGTVIEVVMPPASAPTFAASCIAELAAQNIIVEVSPVATTPQVPMSRAI